MKSIVGLSLVVLLAGLAPAQSISVPDNYGAVYPIPNPVSPVIQAPVIDGSDLPLVRRSDFEVDGPILIPIPLEPNRSAARPAVVNPDDPPAADIEPGPFGLRSSSGVDEPVIVPIPLRPSRSVARPVVVNPDDPPAVDIEPGPFGLRSSSGIDDPVIVPIPLRPSRFVARPGIVNPDDEALDVPPSRVSPGIVNRDDAPDLDRPAVSEGRFPLASNRPGQAIDVRPRSPFFRDRIALAFGPSLVGRNAVAELYDASGRMVLRSNLRVGAVSSIDDPVLRGLPAGNYLLRVQSGPEMYRSLKVSKPLD